MRINAVGCTADKDNQNAFLASRYCHENQSCLHLPTFFPGYRMLMQSNYRRPSAKRERNQMEGHYMSQQFDDHLFTNALPQQRRPRSSESAIRWNSLQTLGLSLPHHQRKSQHHGPSPDGISFPALFCGEFTEKTAGVVMARGIRRTITASAPQASWKAPPNPQRFTISSLPFPSAFPAGDGWLRDFTKPARSGRTFRAQATPPAIHFMPSRQGTPS